MGDTPIDDAYQRKRISTREVNSIPPYHFLTISLYSNMNNHHTVPLKMKSIFQRHRRTTQQKTQQKPLPVDNFQKIPPEIVEILFTFLWVTDQVCLALTCKYLFACYQSFLRVRKTGVTELLWREPVSELRLVRQLQNERWQYCWWCYKLHPFSRWRAFLYMWGYRRKCCPVRDLVGWTIPYI